MKQFQFRVTERIAAYYEGIITIKAESESEARDRFVTMEDKEISDSTENWEQCTDEAEGDGNYKLHSLIEIL